MWKTSAIWSDPGYEQEMGNTRACLKGFVAAVSLLVANTALDLRRGPRASLRRVVFFMVRNPAEFARILAEIRGETSKPIVQF